MTDNNIKGVNDPANIQVSIVNPLASAMNTNTSHEHDEGVPTPSITTRGRNFAIIGTIGIVLSVVVIGVVTGVQSSQSASGTPGQSANNVRGGIKAIVTSPNFCGATYETMSCLYPCPNGVDSECPSGQTCFAAPGFCSGTASPTTKLSTTTTTVASSNFCGATYETMSCLYPCPLGVDSQCPSGQTCFAAPGFCSGTAAPTTTLSTTSTTKTSTTTKTNPTTTTTVTTTTTKTNPTTTTTKTNPTTTTTKTNPTTVASSNFCGATYATMSCSYPCPDGVDSQCPSGQTCFAAPGFCSGGATAAPTTTLSTTTTTTVASSNYCGATYETMSCLYPCPDGVDSQCPSGQTCFSAPGFCSGGATVSPTPSGGTGTGSPITYDQFTRALTVNGWPAPSVTQYNNFVNNYASKGGITSIREAAMFLAQILQESGGLQFKAELACTTKPETLNCPNDYRSKGDDPNLFYYGRGYIQITWSYNYAPASQYLFGDNRLVTNPDQVATDDAIAWNTAFWFWYVNVHPDAGVQAGQFGSATNIINGPKECPCSSSPQCQNRVHFYSNILPIFGVNEAPNLAGC